MNERILYHCQLIGQVKLTCNDLSVIFAAFYIYLYRKLIEESMDAKACKVFTAFVVPLLVALLHVFKFEDLYISDVNMQEIYSQKKSLSARYDTYKSELCYTALRQYEISEGYTDKN